MPQRGVPTGLAAVDRLAEPVDLALWDVFGGFVGIALIAVLALVAVVLTAAILLGEALAVIHKVRPDRDLDDEADEP